MLSPAELQILQHSLGWDRYGQGHSTRNHFCAGAADEPICRGLVEKGYMQEHRTTEVFPYYNVSVTAEGRKACSEQSPKPPKLTNSQQRYRRFIAHDSGLSFGEWLKYYGSAARLRQKASE
jgi:hypothetical protein